MGSGAVVVNIMGFRYLSADKKLEKFYLLCISKYKGI